LGVLMSQSDPLLTAEKLRIVPPLSRRPMMRRAIWQLDRALVYATVPNGMRAGLRLFPPF
jgi:hypothetical protein